MIYYILIFLNFLYNVISIKLNVNKIEKNFKNNSSLKLRLLNNIYMNYHNYSSVNIPLLKSEIGLYSLDIYIGEPKQKFSLVIDSGSSILWVYNNKCELCLSNNKFNPSKSKTFISKKETLNMNYVSGNLKGDICQDNMNFNGDFNMPSFYFLLIYESNIDFKIDGLIGLSKGSYSKKKYSFLNQIYEKNLIKDKYVIYDLFKKYFYISEIPSYLENEKKVTCVDKDDFSTFWRCEISSVQIDGVSIFITTKIIFDSGTNGIIFPIKYLEIFKNIIKNNKILSMNKCSFQQIDNDNIFKFGCEHKVNSKKLNTTSNFIEFFLDKSVTNNTNNNTFGFKLIDLMENEQVFSLYIFDRKDEILLGAPFFEKYPIMFNKDNKIITIFGNGNNLYRSNNNILNNIKIFIIISIFVVLVLLLIIVIREKVFSKSRIKNSTIENLEDYIQLLHA